MPWDDQGTLSVPDDWSTQPVKQETQIILCLMPQGRADKRLPSLCKHAHCTYTPTPQMVLHYLTQATWQRSNFREGHRGAEGRGNASLPPPAWVSRGHQMLGRLLTHLLAVLSFVHMSSNSGSQQRPDQRREGPREGWVTNATWQAASTSRREDRHILL